MQKRWKPNVTVAAVIERDGRFLLVEEQMAEGLRLNNPAGHLDPGESLVDACAREVREETAHPFVPTALVGVYLTRMQHPPKGERQVTSTTYLRFTFTGELGDAVEGWLLDHGIVGLRWMTAEEIRACPERHRSPSLLRSLDDYLAGVRVPLDLLHTDLG